MAAVVPGISFKGSMHGFLEGHTVSELQLGGTSAKGDRDVWGGTEFSGFRASAGGAAFSQTYVLAKGIVPM